MREHRENRWDRRDTGDMIGVCLSDGPRSISELEEALVALPRRFGVFVELYDGASLSRGDLRRTLETDLGRMASDGLVEPVDGRYRLTAAGHARAETDVVGLRRAMGLARALMDPERVSQVSLAAHLGLAALKLPAGLISGSVGLINDAADTALDGVASLLVYLGFRFNRERAVNVILVLLMLGTGVLTCIEAVRRLVGGSQPQVGWLPFAAAVVSALICGGLWAYQRYVGLRRGRVALIIQSVDSRNHVIVAAGVIAGLAAALLGFPLLDTLVGLAVSALVLKSGVELAIETARSLQGDAVDLSRYSMGLLDRYDRFRHDQLRDWMLYLVRQGEVRSRDALRERALDALAFEDSPLFRKIGLGRQEGAEALVETSLADLFARGWLTGEAALSLTGSADEHLAAVLKSRAGGRRRRANRHT